MIKELVQKNRSYRRFYEEKRISMDTLKELISIARLTHQLPINSRFVTCFLTRRIHVRRYLTH